MTKIQNAQESFAAAVAFRAAMFRMRTVIGDDAATAITCQRHADTLLDAKFLGSTLSQPEISALSPDLGRTRSLVEKIQTILGDRAMQSAEVYQALVVSGEPETRTLRHAVSGTLSKHGDGRGRMLFTKVRHGWYKNRRPGDADEAGVRVPSGFLVRAVYDAMGNEGLTIGQVVERCVKFGKLPLTHCSNTTISAVLANHSVRGSQCFERLGHARYRKVPGRRPDVQVPLGVTLDLLCSILRQGPLLFGVIYERFRERRPESPVRHRRLKEIMLGNADKNGKRLFHKLTKQIWGLALPDVLSMIMKVMNGGDVLSPKQVQVRIRELGHALDTNEVSAVMRRHSGDGMPLARYKKGLYGRKS